MGTVPVSIMVAKLEACRDEMARQAERCRTRVDTADDSALQVSLGRELDAIGSRLAQVRRELAHVRGARR
jgi:hypothetical protein